MSDFQFDRLIDSAARQMVSHVPSRRLRGAVMARLREPEPVAPRRLAWMTATAAMVAVVLGAMVVALMNRSPALQSPPPVASLVGRQPQTTRPLTVQTPPPAADQKPMAVAVRRRSRVPVWLPPNDVSAIEPLETEPIVMTAVEVPPLGSERTPIDHIEIEALTIEPLTASND